MNKINFVVFVVILLLRFTIGASFQVYKYDFTRLCLISGFPVHFSVQVKKINIFVAFSHVFEHSVHAHTRPDSSDWL